MIVHPSSPYSQVMVATINPEEANHDETLSTLRFSDRMQSVVGAPAHTHPRQRHTHQYDHTLLS